MQHTFGSHNYYVYIITNKIKTVLYIGFTTDLKERLYYHANPEPHSKAFTAKYKYCYLIYFEHYQDVQIAIDRETQLKKWNRAKKENLINGFNPQWRFLNNEV
ncbi:endonuclease [Flavobacterium akiainvivens]|uniref:Endonuclease n=1 Tax=Flavobacterium akiainvivens TaxID=1202724 RepID=A0A0M9VID1_9FLAO|nr:GIY-YIG nuclease family protein [Flavobacterium akiainvivens]KOS06536.1 endonuclease [Flavobacterium akiainvivens]SFQ11137.1 putative endonuclease [Flavobacterium akiainvivens]